MPDQPSLLQAMPSKREKRDKSWKEDKNTANKKKRAAAKRFKGSPSALSPSHLPEVALDLYVVFGGCSGCPKRGGADERY